MKTELKRILFATHNKGKIQEVQKLLEEFGIEVLSSADFNLVEPDETGKTFEENALLKAKAGAIASGLPTLADDSGICVAAMGGKPGIHSKRWLEDFENHLDAFEKLREVTTQAGDYSADLNSVMVLYSPDGSYETFYGQVKGSLVFPPQGENNFGYDPVFMPEGFDVTYGQMTTEEKKSISHRRIAVDKFLEWLSKI